MRLLRGTVIAPVALGLTLFAGTAVAGDSSSTRAGSAEESAQPSESASAAPAESMSADPDESASAAPEGTASTVPSDEPSTAAPSVAPTERLEIGAPQSFTRSPSATVLGVKLTRPRELARTGRPLPALVLVALGLLGAGVLLQRAGVRVHDGRHTA